ncbi:hypothetical protein LTR01_004019 [Friedmanniomyces endolithicus]|nr:hypothetical protein LTR01_004019 [Friedmanniomyces endolithicus]
MGLSHRPRLSTRRSDGDAYCGLMPIQSPLTLVSPIHQHRKLRWLLSILASDRSVPHPYNAVADDLGPEASTWPSAVNDPPAIPFRCSPSSLRVHLRSSSDFLHNAIRCIMMAQELQDAYADFVALDSDPVSGQDAAVLVKDLHRAANVCTRANVQRCTSSIIATCIATSTRTAALCRLLLAICRSFAPGDPRKRVGTTGTDDGNAGLGKSVDGKVKEPPQPHFKRLHVLYIVSDVLITLQRQHRSAQNPVEASGVETLKRHLPALAALATFKGREEYARTLPAVMSLLNIWSIEGLISEADLVNVYAAAISADEDRSSWEDFLAHLEAKPTIPGVSAREASIANLALPKRHGVPNDPTAPWHELPATNGLYMKQTRGYPLKASVMPMGGYDLDPADEQSDAALRLDVQWLHKEILHAFDKFTDPEDVKDIDALGNVIFKDPARPTRNYWGWSLDGVSKMKDVSKYHQENASDYADVGNGRLSDPMDQVNAAVDRARSLAAERAGSMRGRGGAPGARRGRGGRRW